MIQVTNKIPSAKAYIDLRIKTGMTPKDEKKAEVALANTLYIVSLWDNDQLIGLGRVIGDGGCSYVVSDIMVHPNYQRQGHGKTIMKEIDRYLEENTDEYAYVCLIADKPADQLYKQFKFDYVEPKSTGMKRRQTKSL